MTGTAQATKLSFVAPVNQLLEATMKVGSIVPSKGDKPIISNIRLSVQNGVLEIAGTDLRAFLYHQVPEAKVVSEGVGLISCARLLEILKEYRDHDVSFSFESRGGCKVRVKDDTLRILVDDPRDFPAISRFDSDPGFEIVGDDLIDMIHKTEFAAAVEATRLAINGVLFERKGTRFRLVATDTKRISYTQKTVQLPIGTPLADMAAVAPLSCLKLLSRAISKGNGQKLVTVGVSGSYLFFRMHNATAFTLIVNGRYPPYEDGFKVELTKHVDVSVDSFIALLKRILLVDHVGAAFDFTPGRLTLRSQAPTVGTGDVSMPIVYSGDPVRIGWSPKFVLETLESMTAERCRLNFEGPRRIGLLRELVATDTGEAVSDDFCCAIMPMVVTGEASQRSPDV